MKITRITAFSRLSQSCKVAALCLLVTLLWGQSDIRAEPYLAIQEGYKCSKCHVNMTGGGKRTDFANIYVQTRLSANFMDWREYLPQAEEDEDTEENPMKSDSNSSFFSGRLNDYIAIGGDFRASYENVHTPNEGDDDGFSRDKYNIYLEVDLIPERVIFYQTVQGGDADETLGLLKGELGGEPYYFKFGKFFLPYGLRLQDDTAFIRAVTGFTYGATDEGIEFGYEPGPWAMHIATTNGTGGSGDTNLSKQVTASVAYVDKRFRVGASYNRNKTPEDVEVIIYGINGGAQFGRLGVLLEADIIDVEDPTGDDLEQYVSILEFNLLISRGHNLKFSYEYHDPDEDIYDNANERYSIVYEPFLYQFVQVRVGARDNEGIPQDPSLNTSSYFAELHLFF
ncbi:MAG: hypothetical protein GWP56_00315 [Gammaproteobacteria bacterium]|jgi:hypothetical protein|nr:hypothetical protein [Gammaproteobacteria bacterium]